MSRYDHLRMSFEEHREAMRDEFKREMAKFERAKQQFVLLENKSDRLVMRTNNAMLNRRRSFRYSYRLQGAVVLSMQNLFFEYSRVKKENMDNLYSRLKEIRDAEIAAEAALQAVGNAEVAIQVAENAAEDVQDEAVENVVDAIQAANDTVAAFGGDERSDEDDLDDVDDYQVPGSYEDEASDVDGYQVNDGYGYDDDESLNSLDYAFLEEEDDFSDTDSEDYSDDDDDDFSSDESVVYEVDTAYPDSEYDIGRVKLLALEKRTERIEAQASDDEELDISLD